MMKYTAAHVSKCGCYYQQDVLSNAYSTVSRAELQNENTAALFTAVISTD